MGKKYAIEKVVTIVLLTFVGGILVWSRNLGANITWDSLLEKIAFAILVALAVRWLTILFAILPETRDIYEATGEDIRNKILEAEDRIWILQTWLPGVGGDAKKILASGAKDIKIILASFANGSPIYA